MKAKMLIGGILLLISFILPAATAIAGEKDFQINSADSIKSILERYVGQRVTVRLQSGEESSGIVAKVGDLVVHLSELAGREFYDAVIRLDRIDAVVLKVRSR